MAREYIWISFNKNSSFDDREKNLSFSFFSSILMKLRPVQGVSWILQHDKTWQNSHQWNARSKQQNGRLGWSSCDMNIFQLDETVPLGGELCKEIPSRGFEPLLQSCTTQRLAGILLSRTSSVRISIVFVKKNNCKNFSGTHLPHTWLDDATSLSTQLS